MTGIADTRFFLALEFPPTDEIKARAVDLFQREISRNLVAPSIVLAEFIKIAGASMGEDSARTRIRLFKERGMRIAPLEEAEAMIAGHLLLAHRNVPTADAFIASFVKNGSGEYVITDDPHYKLLDVKTRWF